MRIRNKTIYASWILLWGSIPPEFNSWLNNQCRRELYELLKLWARKNNNKKLKWAELCRIVDVWASSWFELHTAEWRWSEPSSSFEPEPLKIILSLRFSHTMTGISEIELSKIFFEVELVEPKAWSWLNGKPGPSSQNWGFLYLDSWLQNGNRFTF